MTTATLAMFPLELVVYPGEELALHIFEERYQELIHDCENSNISFGIPTYINASMHYGTEVRLQKVVKRYPSGASDVLCIGLSVFCMEEFYPRFNGKLYAGASIEYQPNILDGVNSQKDRFLELLYSFYEALEVDFPHYEFDKIDSYTFAHKLGFSLENEYEYLQIASEAERYVFMIEHLKHILPTIRAVNRTKELIKLNGHFKNFDPLDFKAFKR